MSTLQSGRVYLSIATDSTSKELIRATRADDPDRVRQIHQAIETANDLWRSWALANSGEILSASGSELRIRIPTEKLNDVGDLRRRYATSTDSTVSIGFGTKLSEADQALKAAQSTGGDQILMYSPKILDLIQEQEESDKPALKKADDIGMNKPAAGGGMTAAQEPMAPAAIATEGEASEHEENEALRQQMAVGGDVQNPADDIHAQLGQMATQQAQKDDQESQAQQAQQQQAQGQDDIRSQVVKILKVFKDRAQELEGLQEQDPELYESLTGMLQIMIQMSKDYFGAQANEQDAQQVQKSEDLFKALPRNEAENQANMQHESVLQDMVGEKGTTRMGADLPAEVKVGQRTSIGPMGNLRPEKFSMGAHGRTMAADRANVEESGYLSSRSDNLDSLENEVRNDNFTVPSFRNRLTWWFGHEHASADSSQLPIIGQDGRNVALKPGESYLHASDLGGRHIYYHLTPTGAQEVPDSNGGLSGHSTPDLVDHINKHTAHLRNSLDPNANQFGTDTRHQAVVDSSAENIPNAAEMRSAMGRSPVFKKKLGKADLMPGGKGDNKPDTDFDHDELAAGIRAEASEHGLDLARAKEVAKDHLTEDPKYYTKLKVMEKAWPRNEHENKANAAAHPVMEDALLEQGGGKEVHDRYEAPRAISRALTTHNLHRESRPPAAQAGWAEASLHEEANADYDNAALQDPGGRIPIIPLEPHNTWEPTVEYPAGPRRPGHGNDYNDHAFWNGIDHLTTPGHIGNPNPASNAAQIPNKADMMAAKARSPIMARAKQDMSKAALEAGKTGRHQVNYPVGTQIDGAPAGGKDAGQLKVQDPATGKTKWRSVRAGIVMAPDGTPTSSRNPGGSGGSQ